MKYKLLLLIFIGVIPSSGFGTPNVSADFLLNQVDSKRAPSESFSSIIEIITTEDKEIIEQNQMKILTKIKENGDNRSFGIILKPEKEKGRKFLLIDTDSWLYIPGSEKPIKISSAQKLSGNASTGDILSVNYKADYTPNLIGEETISNVNTYQLELIAQTPRVTYYKIILFIDKNNYRPVKCDYYSKSGKVLKVGYFRKYEPFNNKDLCTEMIIIDNIQKKRITLIKYSNYKNEQISDSYFNKDLLKDIQLQ